MFTEFRAWVLRFSHWGQSIARRSKAQLRTLYLRDRNGWDHMNELEKFI